MSYTFDYPRRRNDYTPSYCDCCSTCNLVYPRKKVGQLHQLKYNDEVRVKVLSCFRMAANPKKGKSLNDPLLYHFFFFSFFHYRSQSPAKFQLQTTWAALAGWFPPTRPASQDRSSKSSRFCPLRLSCFDLVLNFSKRVRPFRFSLSILSSSYIRKKSLMFENRQVFMHIFRREKKGEGAN